MGLDVDAVRSTLASFFQLINQSGPQDTSATPGAATHAGFTGKAAIAIAAASVVITNPMIRASSKVFAWIQQAAADATLTSIVRTNVPAAGGSVTITGNAAATAAVVVGYVVLD